MTRPPEVLSPEDRKSIWRIWFEAMWPGAALALGSQWVLIALDLKLSLGQHILATVGLYLLGVGGAGLGAQIADTQRRKHD